MSYIKREYEETMGDTEKMRAIPYVADCSPMPIPGVIEKKITPVEPKVMDNAIEIYKLLERTHDILNCALSKLGGTVDNCIENSFDPLNIRQTLSEDVLLADHVLKLASDIEDLL